MSTIQLSAPLLAFAMTAIAGLSTGIGSALAFFTKKTSTRFLSFSLGFSAGVMLYVSFVEIFPIAKEALIQSFGEEKGYWYTTLAFFGGIVLIAIIDNLVPSFENPHEMRAVEEISEQERKNKGLYRMGILSAIAIAIHNFPEGLATFTAALKDPTLGASVMVAIAIHNIPEGIAVSVPIYYATGKRRKAFFLSFISGLAEPVGALVGYFLLKPFFSDAMFGFIFAGVAGIMVFISLDELLPAAQKYGEHHHISIYGLVLGMVVMALSLLLL